MAIRTRNSHHKNSQSSEATATLNRKQQLFSFCKYSSRVIIILRQNVRIGICNGAATEEAIRKGKSSEVKRKKELPGLSTRAACRWTILGFQVTSSKFKNKELSIHLMVKTKDKNPRRFDLPEVIFALKNDLRRVKMSSFFYR